MTVVTNFVLSSPTRILGWEEVTEGAFDFLEPTWDLTEVATPFPPEPPK